MSKVRSVKCSVWSAWCQVPSVEQSDEYEASSVMCKVCSIQGRVQSVEY